MLKSKALALRTNIFEIMGITGGAFIIALGLNCFLVPNKIAAGGFSGLATIIFHFTGWPVGGVMLALNIPLFILAFKRFGLANSLRSFYGTLILSLLVDGLERFLPESALTQDVVLASIYGGVVCGIGLGICFHSRGTTGGAELLAQLIHSYTRRLSIGWVLFLVDGLVIILAALVFDLELALFALISVYITIKLVDLIQGGFSYSKAVCIISDHYSRIAQEISLKLERGITALDSRGHYSGNRRDMLLVVVSQSQVQEVKKIVQSCDPAAFIIITSAHEVVGEGFTKPDS